MAIKPCRECTKDVSTEAKTCPHCGVSDPTKAKASPKDTLIGTAVLIAIVAGLVTMCGDSDAEKQAKAEEAKAKQAECQKDLQCIGDQLVISAGFLCPKEIEKLAKNSAKWLDGTLEPKFSSFRWRSKRHDVVTLIGDKVQFQNGFGANINMIYECDMTAGRDPVVLEVRVREGKL